MFIDTTLSTRLQLEVKRHREELDTAYEELQSTNEELETTNEELQSGNEELETMNEEMRIRSGELDEARTFLEGVLSSLAAGVVVLDSGMLVKNWNRGAEELWGLPGLPQPRLRAADRSGGRGRPAVLRVQAANRAA
jgi:two-component system, chemotaxis family, CheB/CheR fusion protein